MRAHETNYQALYVQGRGELRRELTWALRTGRTTRHPRRSSEQPRYRLADLGRLRILVHSLEQIPTQQDGVLAAAGSAGIGPEWIFARFVEHARDVVPPTIAAIKPPPHDRTSTPLPRTDERSEAPSTCARCLAPLPWVVDDQPLAPRASVGTYPMRWVGASGV